MFADWAEKHVKKLPVVLAIATCFSVGAALAVANAMKPEPLDPSSRISDTGTLLVVMRDGCGWCDKFRDEMGPKYKRSEYQAKAPLRYIDAADTVRSKTYQFKSPVNGTPTLIMVDTFGREVGRYPGYPGTVANLNTQVDWMLRRVK